MNFGSSQDESEDMEIPDDESPGFLERKMNELRSPIKVKPRTMNA